MTEPDAAMNSMVDPGPASWFDGAARVLFVHAHPDDARANRRSPFLGFSRLRRARLGLGI